MTVNTRLLPLLSAESDGVGIFKTFSGVRRTGSDDAGIQLDLVFYWPIRTSSEARELNPLISGASVMYADRDSREDDDPAKFDYSVTRKFQDDARHLTLNLIQDGTDGGRVILSDQTCMVLAAKLATSKKAASFEVKLRVFGLTPKQVGDLAEGLTSHVGIALESDQQKLFGSTAQPASNVVHLAPRITPKIGQLVSGKLSSGTEFCGIAAELNGEGTVLVRDFGTEIEVSIAQITSALTIVPPKGKTMEWVAESYGKKAAAKGNGVSWAAILSAMGEIHSSELTPSESWTVTSSILDAAAKIEVVAADVTFEDEEEQQEASSF